MSVESALVADVGGTNIRIAIADGDQLVESRVWRCAEFETIGEALRRYLEEIPQADRPRRAAIAVACPAEGDWIDITNQAWSFSTAELRRELDLDELRILNDFTALAASIPRLAPSDTQILKEGTPLPKSAIAVVGPGTGLGVSGLIATEGGWVPLSAEGGHATLVATNEREWAVVEVLRRMFGRVSNERVLSGPGLVNLYRALCSLEGRPAANPTPAEIVAGARTPGSTEAVAIEMFSGWLGTAASDLVLSLGARGGVYIGGGVVPKMIDVFDRALFVERFLDKGRLRDYVEPVPVHLILNTRIALVGAAAILQRG
jgi:glucokinase